MATITPKSSRFYVCLPEEESRNGRRSSSRNRKPDAGAMVCSQLLAGVSVSDQKSQK
ncbi:MULTISPECIES: hypothetical protein [unclassified Moorena]|uniref:hypothetical protein n=1 Tax=unclassified Moorena TaxID=2683338 RepID=UPI0013BBF846|nr:MULTISPECIES: hypothetical protein [unclassified Moorena]NEQ05176.1 hypothetical protein [Moorena sp. SIO4E2]NER85547.1 hypothetical protein [Moorena sp. SIO3A2]